MYDDIIPPTDRQITNCLLTGWIHVGDGLFEQSTTGDIGYFTASGFQKEYSEVF